MLKKYIPVDEVLFVFNKWTLMMNQKWISFISMEDEFLLCDEEKKNIGKAKISKFLLSKNPDIIPVEISILEYIRQPKDIKYIIKV